MVELNNDNYLLNNQEINDLDEEIAPTSKKRKIEQFYSWSSLISDFKNNGELTNNMARLLINEQLLKHNFSMIPLIYLENIQEFILAEEKLVTDELVYFKSARISDQACIKDFQRAFINSCLHFYKQDKPFDQEFLWRMINFCLTNACNDVEYYMGLVYEFLKQCKHDLAYLIKPIWDFFLTIQTENLSTSIFEMNACLLDYLSKIVCLEKFSQTNVLLDDYKIRILNRVLPSMNYMKVEIENILLEFEKNDESMSEENHNNFEKHKITSSSTSFNSFKRCTYQLVLSSNNVKRTTFKSNSQSISIILSNLVGLEELEGESNILLKCSCFLN